MSKQPLPATVPQAADNPWMPSQAFAVSFLFGPAAAGVIAGINYGRMGKKGMLLPCALVGSVLFLLEAILVVYFLPDNAARPAGVITNIVIGLGFVMAQRPTFQAHKSRHWTAPLDGRYRPTKIGLLFLVALACVAAEALVILGMVFLPIHGKP